jgi:hypothetical protein
MGRLREALQSRYKNRDEDVKIHTLLNILPVISTSHLSASAHLFFYFNAYCINLELAIEELYWNHIEYFLSSPTLATVIDYPTN